MSADKIYIEIAKRKAVIIKSDRYIAIKPPENAITESTGSSDAGKLALLNANGKFSNSLLPNDLVYKQSNKITVSDLPNDLVYKQSNKITVSDLPNDLVYKQSNKITVSDLPNDLVYVNSGTGKIDSALLPSISYTSYDNTTSGLTATNSQSAIDELDDRLDATQSSITTLTNNTSYFKTNSSGSSALASGTNSIAVGSLAVSSAPSAIQLGQGINSTELTLQFLDKRLADSNGLYTSLIPTNYTPATANNVTSHLTAINSKLAFSYSNVSSGLTATNYQSAIDELSTTKLSSTAIIPINKGGTGATDAATARINLDVPTSASSLAYSNTTSGLTATNTQSAIDELSTTKLSSTAIIPINKGGTGATDAPTARTNLGVPTSASGLSYSNATSGLTATSTQSAIDEVAGITKKLKVINSNITFYVNSTTGDDINSGLSSGNAFLTLSKALSEIYNYNWNSYSVVIQLGAGNYSVSSGITIKNNPVGLNNLIINGASRTTTVLVDTPINLISYSGYFAITNLEVYFQTITSGRMIFNQSCSAYFDCQELTIRKTSNTSNTVTAFDVASNAYLRIALNLEIAGTSYFQKIFNSSSGGTLNDQSTKIISGTISTTNWLEATSFSNLITNTNHTITGSITGDKFRAAQNCFLWTGTADLNALPGSTAGSFPTSSTPYSCFYNGLTLENYFTTSTALSGNVTLNPNASKNRYYKVTADRTLSLPTTYLDYPYKFFIGNDPTSTANLLINSSGTTLFTLVPGEFAFISYPNSTTGWICARLPQTAKHLTYSNTTSGLTATNSQSAIDEVSSRTLKIGAESATTTVTLIKGELKPLNSTANAITATPPASPVAGDRFGIVDSRSKSATNNITINFSGSTQKFYGIVQNFVMSTNGDYREFVYIDANIGWVRN